MAFQDALNALGRADRLPGRVWRRAYWNYKWTLAAGYMLAKPRARSVPIRSARSGPECPKVQRVVGEPESALIFSLVSNRYQRAYKLALQRQRSAKRAAFEAAQGYTVRPGADWYTVKTSHSYTYNSQGYGAAKYARGACEVRAAELESLGITARVVETEPRNAWATEVQTASATDAAAAERRSPSTVDFVRLCWGKGVNPRVYWPFLPHGFEERHGLDFFGGYVNKERN